MPRLQINLEGPAASAGGRWAVTTNWAVSALPADSSALAAILTTARNTLASSAPFTSSVGSQYSVQRLHGLAYPVPTGPASYVADSNGAAIVGTNAGGPIPLAIVVSERTSAAGPSHRGRSYWPNGQAGVNGTVAASVQTAVRGGWMAMHNAILAALSGAGLSPVHVVFSRKTGDMTPITGICTGDRVDTARGRFAKIPETYLCDVVATGQALQVAPEEVGQPATLSPEEFQAVLNSINLGGGWEDITLGPLKQAAEAFKMYLEARSG